MNPDLYIKSIEELLTQGKLSLSWHPPENDSPAIWEIYKTSSRTGKGETIREAIIDFYKKH